MRLIAFLVDNLPSAHALLTLGPPATALAAAYLWIAARLKRDRSWRTGYTRKVFHFLVFITAAVIQFAFGFRTLVVFGGATSAVIFYALWRGDGDPLYEAMARESDVPHRTWFIVTPYLATLVGGVLANALFGNAALCGYLVAGLGDAIGEPVGTRFGRHRYRVPSFGRVVSYRSVEGSLAVLAVSFLGLALAMLLTRGELASPLALVTIAIAAAVVEAVSPHGWDNLTMQLVPSALAAWMA